MNSTFFPPDADNSPKGECCLVAKERDFFQQGTRSDRVLQPRKCQDDFKDRLSQNFLAGRHTLFTRHGNFYLWNRSRHASNTPSMSVLSEGYDPRVLQLSALNLFCYNWGRQAQLKHRSWEFPISLGFIQSSMVLIL